MSSTVFHSHGCLIFLVGRRHTRPLKTWSLKPIGPPSITSISEVSPSRWLLALWKGALKVIFWFWLLSCVFHCRFARLLVIFKGPACSRPWSSRHPGRAYHSCWHPAPRSQDSWPLSHRSQRCLSHATCGQGPRAVFFFEAFDSETRGEE